MVPRLSRPRFAAGAGLAAVAAQTVLSGCAVGPNYVRPSVPTSASFKEAEGWKLAQPSDALDKGTWWTVFNDPTLSALEQKVEVSNQNLIAAEAAFRQSKALVEEQESTAFPSVTGTGSATRSKSASGV
ncbi:MAG TPA: hypothetical protein VG166_11985, partial [Caulobacteraceae bacterium]|nr:hypothetical protein [Caulobacteraceae bacterium]